MRKVQCTNSPDDFNHPLVLIIIIGEFLGPGEEDAEFAPKWELFENGINQSGPMEKGLLTYV